MYFKIQILINPNTNISESQSITSVQQIFQFYFHAVYFLALVFKRASLCNWQHKHNNIKTTLFSLMLWIVFVVWLTDERGLALFLVETIARDPHHRQSPTRRKQDKFQASRITFKLLCYFNLTKLKEAR